MSLAALAPAGEDVWDANAAAFYRLDVGS